MSPVAMSLEELIPSNQSKSHMYAILIRTALVISTLLVGLTVPFFGKFSHSILIVMMLGPLFPFVSSATIESILNQINQVEVKATYQIYLNFDFKLKSGGTHLDLPYHFFITLGLFKPLTFCCSFIPLCHHYPFIWLQVWLWH